MAQIWQEELKGAITSRGLKAVEARYRTLVPEYYLSLIDPNDPEDPIARMALPQAEELLAPQAGLRDPIGDLTHKAAPRLTHRYPDRALLHVTNLCPMYCRFCFRKNLMNEREEEMYLGDFAAAFSYLAVHPEIEELIFTGGDPWMLADEKLSGLVNAALQAAPHLQRLRFHTRMPVTLPSRITDGLLKAIQRPAVQTVVVTHFNHPREVSAEARVGLQKLRQAGWLTLNQTVLLKGVNNDSMTLKELFQQLGREGVLPYYLHHCDLVEGAEHFRTSIEEGRRIWADLRGRLPGYLIPEYVIDTPGGGGKLPIGADFIEEILPGTYRLGPRKQLYSDPNSVKKIPDKFAPI